MYQEFEQGNRCGPPHPWYCALYFADFPAGSMLHILIVISQQIQYIETSFRKLVILSFGTLFYDHVMNSQ